jgi:DHA1 family tetracycline resistance protein-like MFS transporter
MTEQTSATKGSLLVITLVVIVDMIGFGIIIPFLTFMVDHLAPQGTDKGIWVAALMSAYAGAVFLFSSFWGTLSDRYGRRPILMFGLAGNTVAFVIFGLSTSLWMAFFARLLAGLFNANIPVARAYISDVSRPEEVAKRQGLIGVAFGVGFTIGPALGGWLSRPASWTWTDAFVGTIFETHPYLLPCLASSGLSLFALLLAFRLLPESHALENRSKAKKTTPMKELKSKFSDIGSLMKRPVISPLLFSGMFFWVGFTIMHVVFILFTMMPAESGGLDFSESDNGIVFAFIGLVGMVTQGGMIGPLTERYGSSRLIAMGLSIAGLGLIAIPYVDISIAWTGMLVTSLLIAFGNGLFTPSNMAMLSNHSSYDERGLVMGVSESLRSLCSLFGVLIGGIVWDLTWDEDYLFTYHTAFWLCGLFSFIAVIIHVTGGAWGVDDPALKGKEVEAE